MGEQGGGVAVELVFVEPKPKRLSGLATDKDVLRDGKVIHQLQFLMNDADARGLGLARTGEVDRLVVEPNFARIFCINASENLHQRRFARPVFTHQRVNFAGDKVETDLVQRAHAGKTLAKAIDGDERGHDWVGAVRRTRRFGRYRGRQR